MQLVDIRCFNMLFHAFMDTFDLTNISNNHFHKKILYKVFYVQKVKLGTKKRYFDHHYSVFPCTLETPFSMN